MKRNKGIKITFIILTIILLSMISFVGIYVQDKNQIKNIMPEYLLGRDLEGYRRIELKVSDQILETIKYDAEGNVITGENSEVAVARTEEKKVNTEENLNSQNYSKSKEIIEKRLKEVEAKDYTIRQDKENGTIILELAEDSNTDRIVGQISSQGKFEIVDNDTNEVLMTNDDLKSVKAGYGGTDAGQTAVFINIQFNKEGTEKFKNITNTYIEIEKEDSEVSNEIAESETESAEETQTEDNKEEKRVKEIAIKVDDSTLLTTYFDKEISNGLLQLVVGSASTDAEELQESLLEAKSMSALLGSGKMPIVYELEQNKFIYTNITMNEIAIIISIVIALLTIAMIYIIIKYKAKGILASISLIGYVAILLIALRFFNVEISIAGIIGIILSIAVNYCILVSILKEKQIISVIKKYAIILVPTLTISIVFTFMNITMGMVMFWGITLGLLYNLSITNMMLKD